mmetsp:Transcript_18836/g.29677  ORF Transcript_18836/g.29677 Transcript_18836/m.29677 type:complete len:92 (-) Transcript_18836:628-903(-)
MFIYFAQADCGSHFCDECESRDRCAHPKSRCTLRKQIMARTSVMNEKAGKDILPLHPSLISLPSSSLPPIKPGPSIKDFILQPLRQAFAHF